MIRRSRRKNSRRRNDGRSFESLERRSLLTTFTVTSLADNTIADGETTLREAIEQANATAGDSDAIVFEAGLSGTITLALGRLDVVGDLIVTGNGEGQTVIDASGNSDIFMHQTEGHFTVRSMTLLNAENSAINHPGGGFYPRIRVENTTITGAGGRAVSFNFPYGEADYSGGLSILDSTITGNGHGVSVFGRVGATITGSSISDNDTGGVFGLWDGYGSPSLTIQDSVISGNESTSRGGGITFFGRGLTLEDSLVEDNIGQNGGGIYVEAAHIGIQNSTISGNTATGNGGGVHFNAYNGNSGFFLNGIINSTISGNSAVDGGGVFFDELPNTFPIHNSTITDNNASGRGGGLFFDANPRNPIVSNILAGNTATTNGPDLFVTTISNADFRKNLVGSNAGTKLEETGTSAPDGDGNFIGSEGTPVDPGLTGLVDVGILRVHQPTSGSLTVNNGSNPDDLSFDQVGNPRENGTSADIGAVELPPSALVVSNPSVVEADNGEVLLVFPVEMTQAAAGPFTIDATTLDGTATAGSDYESRSATLSFSGNAGQVRQFVVTVNSDTIAELDETVLLTFSNITDTQISLPSDALGTIVNDDSASRIELRNGIVRVTGTSAADTIAANLVDSKIQVHLNNEAVEYEPEDVASISIQGAAGNDLIQAVLVTQPIFIDAGAGDDTVKGGVGNDRIIGGEGDDNLRGTKGDDVIIGGDGNDSLRGQVGDDTLIGGDGNDTLQGAEDDDSLRGDAGNDLLEGGSENDKLSGGGGNDTLLGEAGNDRLNGGGGPDRMLGGAGDDVAGGGSGADSIVGGNGDDSLNGGNGPDTLTGGNGDDTLRGRNGDDVLLGDDGDDFIKGLVGRDISYGGHGADEFFANSDDDLLIAGVLTPLNGLSIVDFLSGGIRDEWLSARSYDQRVANIRNGSGGTQNRLNDEFLIGRNRSGQTVFDDGVEDDVRGGNQTDLFFARLGEDLLDAESAEFTEGI
jgi:CSLREA domain-containing protein